MRRLRVCASLAISWGATLLFASATAYAGDPAAAREQLKLGYNLSHEGKCEEALPHLLESLRLDPKAITLINLANCEEKTGRLAEALGHWIDARARAQAEGARAIDEEAQKRQKDLEPRLAKLTIVLAAGTPREALVARDGVTLGTISLGVPLPVNPGQHTIVVSAPGHADGTTQVVLAEAESKSVEVSIGQAAPVPPPRDVVASPKPSQGVHPLTWIGFGVAGASALTGTITGLMAMDKANSAERDCPDLRCRDARAFDDVEAGRTLGTVSTIAFAVTGAGVLVGLYGLFFAGRSSSGTPTAAVSLGPGAITAFGSF